MQFLFSCFFVPEISQSLHCFGHTLVRFLIQLLSLYHLVERTLPLYDHTSAYTSEGVLLVQTDLHNEPCFAKPENKEYLVIKENTAIYINKLFITRYSKHFNCNPSFEIAIVLEKFKNDTKNYKLMK